MKASYFCFATVLSFAAGQKISLRARSIDSNLQVHLGDFDYNKQALSVTPFSPATEELVIKGASCIDAALGEDEDAFPCFSYLELMDPLHYDLIVDLHGENISKLSLVYNSDAQGIVPVIRHPVNGPEAPAIKLKKVTKTYKDKKAAKNAATAQFEEDADLDNRSWFQKNWKMLLIGLVAYNLISVMSRQQPQEGSQGN